MKRTRSLQKFATQFGYEHKNRSNPFSSIKKHASELSKLLDNLITDRKSESIIDFAEIIHINKHDRDYRIFLFCASYEISKKAHEIIPVVKSGNDIIILNISQFIILVLQL